MKEFDIAVGLGFLDDAARALVGAGLQNASGPFDGLHVPSPLAGARLLAGRFEGWLERAEDLELVDMSHSSGFVSRLYRNRRDGCVLMHDFDDGNTLEKAFESVRSRYQRRISRLLDGLASARRILCFYLEDPRKPCCSDGDLASARQLVADAWKDAEVTLLYVYERPDCHDSEERVVSPGVVSIGLEYRTWIRGEVSHVVDMSPVVSCLRQRFRIADRREGDDRSGACADREDAGQVKWGPNRPARWINRRVWGIYRRIGSYLERQGLVPPEHSVEILR